MMMHSTASKKHSFFSIFFAFFGIVISAAVIVSLFIAMKQNTEIRSQAAIGARKIIKTWTFNNSTEGWKKISGGGKIEVISKNLVFQLTHIGLMHIQKTDNITFPEGNKYIRFSIMVEKQKAQTEKQTNNKEAVVAIGGGGPCSKTKTCPKGYTCVNVNPSGSGENNRCLSALPTDTITRIPMTIQMIVNKSAKSKAESAISIPVELIADGTYHTYDIFVPNSLNSVVLRYLIFEFADSKKAIPPQTVKIDDITLELMPIVPSPKACIPYPTAICPSPDAKGVIGPCHTALRSDIVYCPKPTEKVTPSPKACVPYPTPICPSPDAKGVIGPCRMIALRSDIVYCPKPTQKVVVTSTAQPLINDNLTCNYSINPPRICPNGLTCVAVSNLAGANGICR